MFGMDDFFANFPASKVLFGALSAMIDELGPSELRVQKSQIVFTRKKDFAWVWIPGQYLKGKRRVAPLVLTLHFPAPDPSPRWKEIVEPYSGRFMHHLEVWSDADLDEQVGMWLRESWERAG